MPWYPDRLTPLARDFRLFQHAWRLNRRRAVDVVASKFNDRLVPDRITGLYAGEGAPTGRILLSYMVEPFHLGPRLPKFHSTTRQSNWQAREIVRALHERGYVVDVYRLDADVEPDDFDQYDALFGLEPNFARYARRLKDGVPAIYYATGMHWSQRNPAIRQHVERLEHRRGVSVPVRRLLPETDAEALADALIVIGDRRTAATYLDHVGKKPTYDILSTTYPFLDDTIRTKDFDDARTSFLWFTGGDLVTKGLDVTIEAFADRPNLDLYVCGPLETDMAFVDIYREELFETHNIHPLGWTDVATDRFLEVTNRCAFVIHSGISEGFPGSLAHCMRRGLVPLVTPDVVLEPDGWGISIPAAEPANVAAAIERAAAMPVDDIRSLARASADRAASVHSREAFAERIREILDEVL